MSAKFMLYGANGYTGNLIARLAVDRGLRPILAARNLEKIASLAAELGLDYRTFALDDEPAIDAALADITVVLHCAGPFSQTSSLMVASCLRTQTHYLDITGEVAVFAQVASQDAAAKAASVMLLPGVGFDVVPSDCLAAHLKNRLPSATRLALGFQALGRLSRGTAITMLEAQDRGGLIRQNGVLTPVPAAFKNRSIDFGQGEVQAITIPWGDVFTAYYSTGIPNIEVYAAFPTIVRLGAIASRYLGWLLNLPAMQNFQKSLIQNQPPGPTEIERLQGKSYLWAEVADNSGKRLVSRLQCPEGYTLTALTALKITQKVLDGEYTTGFQTPSLAYGADFILQLPDVGREDVD